MTNQYNVLVAPVTTEKSVGMAGKYTFKVHPDATKPQIKKAVEAFYGTPVDEVKIVAIKPKFKYVARGVMGRKRSAGKKAIVTLKDGKTLNFNDFK